MRKFASMAILSIGAFALASCGDTEDASADAEAENVEISADEPLAGAGDPVEDPNALADDTSLTEEVNAAAAGEAAADAAADVVAAAEDEAGSMEEAAGN
ncbi:MAG TPA: hypothetical protein VLA37_12600 [Sphingomonadaceae bacterium]|nr:hypothetical protein [Sphingomonadaceae bacterium]